MGGQAVMDQDNTEHTTENTVDLLDRGTKGVSPSRAGAVQAFMDQHRAQKAANEEEDRTVELENGLQDLVDHVGDDAEKDAPKARRQSQGSSGRPPVPRFAANDERTVELETDLNALLGAAGGSSSEADALNDSTASRRSSASSCGGGGRRRNTVKGLSVQLLEDDSDDSTQEADDDDEAPDIRLSFDSHDSLTSAVSDARDSNQMVVDDGIRAQPVFFLTSHRSLTQTSAQA